MEALHFDLFSYVPKDVCAQIMSYLDPFSYSKLAQTNKMFYSLSVSDAMNGYFKNLCVKLFRNNQPPLPTDCRFEEIRDYVLTHAHLYGPNITNAVTHNLRYFVWKS